MNWDKRRLVIAACVAGMLPATANAYPFATQTVFGDLPALEHEPKPILDMVKIGGRPGVAPAATSNRALVKPAGPNVAGTVVLPGIETARRKSVEDSVLSDGSIAGAFNDSRLMDEADEIAAQSQGQLLASAAKNEGRQYTESEVAEAVLAAAQAAQDSETDESVQVEMEGELEEDLQIIEFGEVKVGEIAELTGDEGGVLGLVKVTKFEDDEVVLDENGNAVNVRKKEAESDSLVKLQAQSVSAVSTNVPTSELARLASASGKASDSLFRRLTTEGPVEEQAPIVSAQQIASLTPGTYALNVDSFSAKAGDNKRPSDSRRFSWELFLAMLRASFLNTQTYVGLGIMTLAGIVVLRMSRAVRRG